MADEKVKITQLPLIQDAESGLLLTNKGGIDYQTPVNQLVLIKNNLSDIDPSVSRSNLNVYSKDETLSLTGGSMQAFSSEAEGVSSTTDGQYFMVPSGGGGVKYYKNNSGTAVLVGTVIGPSSIIGTIREYPDYESAQNDINTGLIPDGLPLWVNSEDGTLIADEYINNGGTLIQTGRQMPSQLSVDAIIHELIDPGVNLFNQTTVTRGYYLFEGTGVPTANPDYCYSERIGIVGDAPYTTRISTRVATFFDADGIYLSDVSNVTSFTAPASAAFVVVSVLISNLDVFQLNFGVGQMPYTSYKSIISPVINGAATNGYVALGFAHGKNFFNPSLVFDGRHLSSTGTITNDSDTSMSVSGYMKIDATKSYCSNQQWRAAAYYDAKGRFISLQTVDGYGAKPINALVIPSGAEFMRIEVPTLVVPAMMIEENSLATEFEPFRQVAPDAFDGVQVTFAEEPEETILFGPGVNLFNKKAASFGYINEWGSVYPVKGSSGSGYVYSDYIRVTPATKYKASSQLRFVAFYNTDKQYISTVSLVTEFTPPANSAYARITLAQNVMETMFLSEGDYLAPRADYQHLMETVATDGSALRIPGEMVLADNLDIDFVQHGLLVSGKNRYNKNTRKSGYIDEQGVIHEPDSRYYYSDFIPVTPGAKYAFNSDSRFVAFYARNKGFISSLSDTGQHIRVITTPADCYFVRITTSVAISDTFQMEAGEVSTTYEPFAYSLLSTMPDGTPVTGGGAAPEDATVPDSYGLQRLRETHMRLNKLTYGGNVQFSWAMIGDSYTRGQVRYALKCAQKLWHLYNGTAPVVSVPPIGFGYRSFGYDQYGDNTDIIGTEITQTGFACQYNTGFGLDISSVSSATVGATISWTDDFSLGFAYTLYAGGGSGVISYNAPGMSAPVEIDLSTYPVAVQMIPMSEMPTTGSGTVTITVISGSVVLYGVRIQKETQPGVIVHKLGGSGSHTNNWVNADATRWETAFTTLKANLATIMLGTNDQGIKLAPETFKSNLLTMINRIRTASPTTDIMLICPAENNRPGGNAIPMSSYARKMYELALEQDVAFLNLQSSFGVNPADYAYGSARPWMVSDGLHPDPDTGGYAIAAALMRALSLPMA
ncbi:SGNH/GDSL hydrolase family protein [Klebsiella aerogenes]